MIETSHVQYGRQRIGYSIRRSERRTTVSVAVDPLKGVLLTAPKHVAVSHLDRVVHDKAPWIVGKLRLVESSNAEPSPHDFVSGESFSYLGRHYRLRVVPRSRVEPAHLEHGWLVATVDRDLTGAPRAQAVRSSLMTWFISHARVRLPERVERWAPKVGVPAPVVLVRDQAKRWGSCDARGLVRLNWRLVQAPIPQIDYVIVHELLHLFERHHSPAFWALVAQVVPTYERHRRALMQSGPSLTW